MFTLFCTLVTLACVGAAVLAVALSWLDVDVWSTAVTEADTTHPMPQPQRRLAAAAVLSALALATLAPRLMVPPRRPLAPPGMHHAHYPIEDRLIGVFGVLAAAVPRVTTRNHRGKSGGNSPYPSPTRGKSRQPSNLSGKKRLLPLLQCVIPSREPLNFQKTGS